MWNHTGYETAVFSTIFDISIEGKLHFSLQNNLLTLFRNARISDLCRSGYLLLQQHFAEEQSKFSYHFGNGSLTFLQNISDYCLAFVNRTSNAWQCSSNITLLADGRICGTTTHFTEFAVVLDFVEKYIPPINILDTQAFTLVTGINKNTVGVCILIVSLQIREYSLDFCEMWLAVSYSCTLLPWSSLDSRTENTPNAISRSERDTAPSSCPP